MSDLEKLKKNLEKRAFARDCALSTLPRIERIVHILQNRRKLLDIVSTSSLGNFQAVVKPDTKTKTQEKMGSYII